MASGTQSYTGAYVGTGAALSVGKVPFEPKMIQFYQVDDLQDGTTVDNQALKTDVMPDDTFLDMDPTGPAVVSAGQGVTITMDGFDLGTSAIVNASGKTYLFVAWN